MARWKPLWDRIHRQVETDGDCLIFTGRTVKGYGQSRVGGKSFYVHRAAWEREHGPIPEGMVVMHLCDRPACIAPNHLVLGTQAKNVADMIRKGRQALGERRGSAKLTEAQVKTIRALADIGYEHAKLARQFGVSAPTISLIVHRQKWRHI